MNLPAAGSCLRAKNSELRVLAPSRLRSYFHTRAESWGCHPEACRSPCPSPEQKPARSRAHHPTRWIPSSLFPSSGGGKRKEKNLPLLRDAAMGTPSPAALAPSQLCRAAWEGSVGSARLRRAPRELLPGGIQVRLRPARAPVRVSQNRTLLGARQGTPVLNQLFTPSGLRAPPHPSPHAQKGGSDLQLPRRVVRRGPSWSGGRAQAESPVP